MSRPTLNKTSLQKLRQDLATYRQFLPTLDLKRRQLLAEQAKTRKILAQLEQKQQQTLDDHAKQLATLAVSHISLRRLVKLENIELIEKNIVGIRLPEPGKIKFQIETYNLTTTPVWLEAAIHAVKQQVNLKAQYSIYQQRAQLLEQAVHKTTQRLNLFEKVLIPETSQQIRKIELFLADEETAAVVRAKLAKRKLIANSELQEDAL